MTSRNPHLTADIAGIQSPITFAGTNKARIGQLMDLVAMESADEKDQRAFLDEMSPVCRIHLYRMLTDLQAGVTDAT